MIRLALRGVRFRPGRFVASFVALCFGAVIVTACGGLLETGVRGEVVPQRLAAAPIVVDGTRPAPGESDSGTEDVRLDPGVLPAVAAVPGVGAAVPDVSVPVGVPADSSDVSQAHGWASARLGAYRLTDGRAPDGPGEVVLDAGLAARAGTPLGATTELAVHGRTEQARLVGIVRTDTAAAPAVFLADAEAARLAGGAPTVVGVLPGPGTGVAALAERLDGALAGRSATVLTGVDRGDAEFTGARATSADLIPLSAVFGGTAVLTSLFVVSSTLALLVGQRLREMALLRAVGATPGQLRRMIVGETLAVAVLAVAVSVVPGMLLGRWLFDRLTDSGLVAREIVFHQGWLPVVVATGAALVFAVGSALIASRRAAVTRPTEALAEASLQRRWLGVGRVLTALVCLGGALALAIVTSAVMNGPVAASTAGPSALLWAAGLALLGPGIARVLTAVLHWPLRAVSGLAGYLALAHARARAVRTAGAIVPVMLVTGLATSLIYLQTTQVDAARQASAAELVADAVVTAPTGLPDDIVDRIRRVPGVAAASEQVSSEGFLEIPAPPPDPDDPDDRDQPDAHDLQLRGVTASGVEQTGTVRPVAGSLDRLRGPTVALPVTLARETGNDVGATPSIRFGDGTAQRLAVVATVPDGDDDRALVPADLLAPHTVAAQQALVRAGPGTDPVTLTGELSGLAGTVPGLRVLDRGAVAADASGQNETGQWVNYLLAAMIVGYAAISLVNTLLVATAERRGEIGLQRLVGATRGQVLRMMTVEAVLVTVAGTVLGSLVAALVLGPFGMALRGSPVPSGPPWVFLAVVGVGAALTGAATLVPTALTLRTRPVDVVARE